MPRVLYLGPETSLETVKQSLPDGFEVVWATDETTVDEVIGDCEAVLDAYMRVRFPEPRLKRANKLELFVTATTGADHIDSAELARRGVPLLTLQGQREVLRNVTAAAEHSWLLLMACARRLRGAVTEVMEGGWDRNQHPGLMIKNRTLGIIGCGRIGEWMSRYASAFGATSIGYDPHLEVFPETIKPVTLAQLLAESDFVSIHVPLTENTRELMGASEFAQMKRGVILVNTSRGDIVDERALLAALEDGQVGAAGLDVLTGEPDTAQHPLVVYARSNNNVIITPHIGGFSPDALAVVLAFSCRRIADHFAQDHARQH